MKASRGRQQVNGKSANGIRKEHENLSQFQSVW